MSDRKKSVKTIITLTTYTLKHKSIISIEQSLLDVKTQTDFSTTHNTNGLQHMTITSRYGIQKNKQVNIK